MALVDRSMPGRTGAVRLEFELPCQADSPAVARARLEPLRRELDNSLMVRVRLLVTELVANSVRRGEGDSLWVVAVAVPERVRAEMTVHGASGLPLAPDPMPFRAHGVALLLVRRLADRWDAFADRRGVWFELDRREGG